MESHFSGLLMCVSFSFCHSALRLLVTRRFWPRKSLFRVESDQEAVASFSVHLCWKPFHELWREQWPQSHESRREWEMAPSLSLRLLGQGGFWSGYTSRSDSPHSGFLSKKTWKKPVFRDTVSPSLLSVSLPFCSEAISQPRLSSELRACSSLGWAVKVSSHSGDILPAGWCRHTRGMLQAWF